ncbi:RNA-binding domain-containing protein [Hypoxylon sp. NC1633]|nr:RNA-binding domain-containing protein [Hypoxylon sp. NC1633]
MATAVLTETGPHPPSPSPPQEPSDPSKKRKSQIDEIEVDLSLPEPPSKKAKRLLKKGKPVPAKPRSDDEGDSDDDDGLPIPKTRKAGGGGGGGGAKRGDGKEQRSDHGIWIGNLPFTMTRVELFRWLVDGSGGAIAEANITRVNLPTSKEKRQQQRHGNGHENDVEGEAAVPAQTPQNRGFAYVDFDAEAAAVAALALTESEINGRKVLIKKSSSFEGRPAKGDKESGGAGTTTGAGAGNSNNGGAATMTSRKIYVGNLPFQTDESDLRSQFDKCGDVEWAKVATFEDSGKCKGFGWVKFKECEAAAWAVKGFVRIKEEIETEDDFRDKDDAADADADATGENGEAVEKKFKTRKWWVNRLRGRELKIELAEDDQVRYKKRFRKDAPTKGLKGRDQGGRRSARTEGGIENENGARAGDGAEGSKKKPSYRDTGVASYLTGAVVKPQGKKITFD